MSGFGRSLVLCTMAGATMAAMAVTPGEMHPRAQATNAAGQPVRQADGTPIVYPSGELGEGPGKAGTAAAELRRTSAAAAKSGVASTWQFAAFGQGIGSSGLVFGQVDGKREIYAGNFNGYWYALRYAKDGSATQTFVSEILPAGIRRIALARQGSGLVPHIVVAENDGTVLQYDQQTKKLLSTTAGDCADRGGLQAFTTADMNGDGKDEFLSVCNDNTLVVSGTAYAKWSLANVGGADIVAANLDGDPAIEIATTSGKVVDGKTHAVQWTWPAGFGVHLATVDLQNGKNYQGLIAASGWQVVTAYDIGAQIPVWTIGTPQDIGAIAAGDVDNDGLPELLIGDGQWGAVKAYDVKTQALKGQFANPEHGVTNIVVADVTGDGKTEVLWGAGATDSGSDYLYTGSWASKQIVWQNVDLEGPFLGPLVGDLDGDGIPEVVFASTYSEAAYDSGRLIVLDSRTLKVRAISAPIMSNFAWTGLHDLKLRDMGNGRQSILVAADYLYDGQLEAWQFNANDTFTRTWTNGFRPSSPFYSVDAADVDGDGKMDVIAGAGNAVYAFDGATGALKWQSLQMEGNEITGLGIADFDGDGHLEIVAQGRGGYDYVLDGPTHAVKAVFFGPTSFLRVEQPAGVLPQLWLGGTDGTVDDYAFDGSGYSRQGGFVAGTQPIVGLQQLTAGGDWWVGSAGVLSRYHGKKATYSTANYGTGTGRDVAFLPGKDLVMTGALNGVYGFKVKTP